MRSYLSRIYAILTVAVVIFMIGPVLVLAGASFTTTSFVKFPPEGFTLDWYTGLLADEDIVRGLLISLLIAVVSTLICLALALGIVLFLRGRSGGLLGLLNAFLLAPSFVPSLVIGIALLFFLSQIGLMGSLIGLMAGHVVISLPFALRSLSSASDSLDVALERAAAVYGARPGVVLTKVTIPLLRPGLVAASLFAFLTSFNNVTITLFIAGPTVRTLPVVLFQRAEEVVAPGIAAISTCILIFTFIVLGLLQGRFRIFENIRETRSAG